MASPSSYSSSTSTTTPPTITGPIEEEIETVVTSGSTKEGFLKLCRKTGASKYRFLILQDGTLFLYQDYLDLSPISYLNLKDAKIDDNNVLNQKYSFTIKVPLANYQPPNSTPSKLRRKKNSGASPETYLAAKTEEIKLEWLKVLKEAQSKPSTTSPPKREKSKKKGILFSTQKNISEIVVTSSLGKKIVKEFANEDTIVLLNVLKDCMAKIYSEDKAKKLEKNIYKMSVKTAMLYKGKYISPQELLPVRNLIIKAWSCLIDYCEMTWTIDIANLSNQLKTLEDQLVAILKQHLTPSSINRLKDVTQLLASHETLTKFFSKELEPQQQQILHILRKLWDSSLTEEDKKICQTHVPPLSSTGYYTDPGNFIA